MFRSIANLPWLKLEAKSPKTGPSEADAVHVVSDNRPKLRLPAFTLVEALAAVAILTIALSATFLTVGWVLQTNRMPLELRAAAVLDRFMEQTKATGRFIDETVEMDGMGISRKVEALDMAKGCFLIQLTAMDEQGKVISSYQEILFAP